MVDVNSSKSKYTKARVKAAEGMVLLENKNNALPFNQGEKIAVFGINQFDYIAGGGGAAGVNSEYVVNLMEGLMNKQSEGKIKIYEPLITMYKAAYEQDKGKTGRKDQPKITDDMLAGAKSFADTAIITIGRWTEEGYDASFEKNHKNNGQGYYLSCDEQKLINQVTEAGFAKVIVVLNIATVMDTSWFYENPRIDAVLVTWLPGMEGGNAMADILLGDVNPSGKTVDTFAKSYEDYPGAVDFSNDQYQIYKEDIYVGYRYFQTIPAAKSKVNYPFGYGLSYTSFEITDRMISVENDKIIVATKVTNTGSVSGKEIVQVYYSAPQGKLGKPAKVLVGFNKTETIAPGETVDVTISFEINDMASYDDVGKTGYNSAYVLEKGDYRFYIGDSIDGELNAFVYTVEDDILVQQLSQKLTPTELSQRLRADGTYEEFSNQLIPKNKYDSMTNDIVATSTPGDRLKLSDVYTGKINIQDLIAQMSDADLAELSQGQLAIGNGDTGTIGGLLEYGVPSMVTADGPAGLHLNNHAKATWWPCATLLACTWNTKLIEEVGEAIAEECVANDIDLLLAPSLNIHRNPLAGRNFEYFSEDPLITGEMAAGFVNGVQSKGIGATIKHFAANNKEDNRRRVNSILSERAAREIYLKGFDIAIKRSNPMAVMTSYNPINGIKASTNPDLILEILRGEWKYEGGVLSDWDTNAPHVNEAVAGNDVKMPQGSTKELLKALKTGNEGMTRSVLERNVAYTLNMIMKSKKFLREYANPKPVDIKAGTIFRTGYNVMFKSEKVRMEFSGDQESNYGLSLGYCDGKEYTEYRINVLEAGVYSVSSRIASKKGNGTFEIYIDDEKVASVVNKTKTGGWQNWVNTLPQLVNLTEGEHNLKILFTKGSLNLNWLKFDLM